LGGGDEVRHGLGSEFGDDLLRRHRENGAQGQAELDRIAQKYQEMGALSVGAAGARGDEEAPSIERMGGIVNGYDF
jgi:hypothetical protein